MDFNEMKELNKQKEMQIHKEENLFAQQEQTSLLSDEMQDNAYQEASPIENIPKEKPATLTPLVKYYREVHNQDIELQNFGNVFSSSETSAVVENQIKERGFAAMIKGVIKTITGSKKQVENRQKRSYEETDEEHETMLVHDRAYKKERDKILKEKFASSEMKKLSQDMNVFADRFAVWKEKLDANKVIGTKERDRRFLLVMEAYEDTYKKYMGEFNGDIRYMPDKVQAFYREYEAIRKRQENPEPEGENLLEKIEKHMDEVDAKEEKERTQTMDGKALNLEKKQTLPPAAELKEQKEENIELEKEETVSKEKEADPVEQERYHEKRKENEKKQDFGIKEIDKWLVRNMDHSTGDGGKSELLARVLGLSRREKLLVYYTIINGKQADATEFDARLSSVFVPDLNAFKDKMVASKFLIFRRLTHSYIYWERLEGAMQVLFAYTPLLKEEQEEEDPAEQERVQKVREDLMSEMQEEEKAVAQEYFAKVDAVKASFSALQQRLMLYMEDLKRSEANPKDADLKAEVEKERTEIEGEFNEALQMDQNLTEFVAKKKINFADKGEAKKTTAENVKGSVGMAALGMVPALLGVAFDMGKTLDSVDMTKAVGGLMTGTVNEDLGNLVKSFGKMTNVGALMSVTGVISLIGAVSNVVNVVKTFGEGEPFDEALKIAGLVNDFANIASTGVTTAMCFMAGTKPLADALTAVPKLTEVSHGFAYAKVGVDAVQSIAHYGQAFHRSKKLRDSLSGFGTKVDLHKTDNLESRVARLAEGKNTELVKKATTELISGALAVATLPFVGLSTCVSIGLSLSFPILEKIIGGAMSGEEKLKRQTINDLYGIDKIVEQSEDYKKMNKKDKEAFKESALKEAAAKLGLSSVDSLYNRITDNYAITLLNRTFYDEQGFVTKERLDSNPELKAAKMPYVNLLKSFGCSVRFSDSEEKTKPQLAVLRKKMKIE